MKTAELTGALLDYWVARAEGVPAEQLEIREVPRTDWKVCVRTAASIAGLFAAPQHRMDYSTNWASAGPLLENRRIDLVSLVDPTRYQAEILVLPVDNSAWYWVCVDGDTPLIAICRAVVRAAFGDEVEDLPCA